MYLIHGGWVVWTLNLFWKPVVGERRWKRMQKYIYVYIYIAMYIHTQFRTGLNPASWNLILHDDEKGRESTTSSRSGRGPLQVEMQVGKTFWKQRSWVGEVGTAGCILMGTITYPLPAGTFESMIFRTSWGGICYCNSLEGWIKVLDSFCRHFLLDIYSNCHFFDFLSRCFNTYSNLFCIIIYVYAKIYTVFLSISVYIYFCCISSLKLPHC